MGDVLDVARYIFDRIGRTESRKLQKLTYYAQAWSLAWDGKPLFAQPIEAWVEGPAVRRLYSEHHKQWWVDNLSCGAPTRLSDTARATIDAVLAHYSGISYQGLIELTHQEDPWLEAREGLGKHEKSRNRLSEATMATYYTSRALAGDDVPVRAPQDRQTARVEHVLAVSDQQADYWHDVLVRLADR